MRSKTSSIANAIASFVYALGANHFEKARLAFADAFLSNQ
jgi:hypothetical protein